ncbi:MAG: DUF3871 family protein [Segetibacter sp.]|nr:DUF3871 family protein [Segetibacter sp.]
MEYPVPQLIETNNDTEELELINNEHNSPVIATSSPKPFIEANTEQTTLEEIWNKHIVPVFVKDNEPCISHADFIEATYEITSSLFSGEAILRPNVRVSHPIKGRVPDARYKAAIDLQEHEKTLYYERMAFVIEVPSISASVGGNQLSLTIGGVKAYNLDNMYARKGADEQFKMFIGFQNKVCTNLCVWSDGYLGDLKVKNLDQLKGAIHSLIKGYNENFHLFHLKTLTEHSLTEQQFANLIGRIRMYSHLPVDERKGITPLLLGDTQIGAVVKDFYRDDSFCKDSRGNINLWRLYNLFTGTNKSSYIDTFLDRSVNSFLFVEQLKNALENQKSNWYLN